MNRVREFIGFEEQQDRPPKKAIGICILDSGIFPHMDFDTRIVDFCDFVGGKLSLYDDYGHGTHIAGISSGSGLRSQGRYRGIAAGTKLMIGKVLNQDGDGRIEHFLVAIQWCIQNRNKYNIRLLNISVGLMRSVNGAWQKELLDAVSDAWDHGIVTVCAAGNNGPKRGSVTIPGTQPKVITVGSADKKKDGFSPSGYSGRGPTEDCVLKPEIYAPGTDIVSCGNNGLYVRKTGTSMSVPVVTGCIALLLQQNPFLTPVEVKLRLYESACKMDRDRQTTWGMIYLPDLLSPVTR